LTTHQEEVTSYDCTAMLLSMDWTLHHSGEVMLLSASSPPGLGAGCRHSSQLPRCNPQHHHCLPYRVQRLVLPLTSSASTNTSIWRLHLTATLGSILRRNRCTRNRGIPAATHIALLYDLPRLRYLFTCWCCSCYYVTTLQYPTYNW